MSGSIGRMSASSRQSTSRILVSMACRKMLVSGTTSVPASTQDLISCTIASAQLVGAAENPVKIIPVLERNCWVKSALGHRTIQSISNACFFLPASSLPSGMGEVLAQLLRVKHP